MVAVRYDNIQIRIISLLDNCIIVASASVKLGNYFNVRGALEEGLSCSPQHWPCLENLIVVNFKLCDNFACLKYCDVALFGPPCWPPWFEKFAHAIMQY